MQKGSQLNDRFLWLDGACTFKPDTLANMVLKGNTITEKFFVESMTPEVKQFNRVSSVSLAVKTDLDDIHNDWNIPDKYKKLDVKKWTMKCLLAEISKHPDLSPEDLTLRLDRVNEELDLYEEFGLFQMLKALIYIIDSFRKENVVWGVGRGSACASYILYLIGIHDIDSVQYELQINEFLR